ncbi:hypothetical protein AVEN_240873-1 [Araneus ventricosus]|uniref:Uncharacterized protein n=1 Tax=Araneus ventricosus TaxID=182803 RepID=A0A4Y2TZT7_ARAVE|nr:hypothetical protein AVEN_28365-1 [Araneus ventricosus]GBO05852.1 hypothetical protein AVEN_240873-1 [Araneus ventricosus]
MFVTYKSHFSTTLKVRSVICRDSLPCLETRPFLPISNGPDQPEGIVAQSLAKQNREHVKIYAFPIHFYDRIAIEEKIICSFILPRSIAIPSVYRVPLTNPFLWAFRVFRP